MSRDLAFILRERRRRADPNCDECDGEGTIEYDVHTQEPYDAPCACIFRAGDFSVPDPLADETFADARELARDR